MLRFLVDESTGRGVADQLHHLGGDVLFVPDVLPHADDATILKLAAHDQRIVVTNDKDFGELVFRSGRAHAGVVLLRLADESHPNRVRLINEVYARHQHQLAGAFTVATEQTIRIRSRG